MRQKLYNSHNLIAMIATLACIGTAINFAPVAQALSLDVTVEITFSDNPTDPRTHAFVSRQGFSTGFTGLIDPFWNDLKDSASATGTSAAAASVDTTFVRSGFELFEGHLGNVTRYNEMPETINAFALVSNDLVTLGADAFFDFDDQEWIDLLLGGAWAKNYTFASGLGTASAIVNLPPNTTIQNIIMPIGAKYIFGNSKTYGPEGALTSYWKIFDPAAVINLDIGGNNIAGGYIINENGDISTYGGLTYDEPTGTLSLDTSSLGDLTLTGETFMSLASNARLPGDFNNDQTVDDLDIDLLYDQINTGYIPVDVFDIYDLNIDGVVDAGSSSDMEVLVETVLMSILGDANLDGFVGIEDLNAVNGHWNQTGVGYAEGDIDGDGFVGINDLNMVLGNWGWGTPPSVTASIPEPTSGCVVIFGMTCVGYTRRR